MSDTVPEDAVPPGAHQVTGATAAAAREAAATATADDGRDGLPPAAEDDPAAPAPLGVSRTPTGNADVDARLDRLADADHLTTDGHPEVYEDVHRGLRDALTALDARPVTPAGPGTQARPAAGTPGPHPGPPSPYPQPSSPYQSRS